MSVADDFHPMMAFKFPPVGEQAAMNRVSAFCNLEWAGKMQMSLVGLTGTTFKSLDQFRRALADNGFNARFDDDLEENLKPARIKTLKAVILDKDGTEYKARLLEVGTEDEPVCLEVLVVRMTKAGSPEKAEILKELEKTE